jgi:hypothetical protein
VPVRLTNGSESPLIFARVIGPLGFRRSSTAAGSTPGPKGSNDACLAGLRDIAT